MGWKVDMVWGALLGHQTLEWSQGASAPPGATLPWLCLMQGRRAGPQGQSLTWRVKAGLQEEAHGSSSDVAHMWGYISKERTKFVGIDRTGKRFCW